MDRRLSWWMWITTLAAILIILAGCSGRAITTVEHDGPSMDPTFHDGDLLKFEPVETSELKRGDIILFVPPLRTDDVYIKRLIGLPGEHLEIRTDGAVYVNDTLLDEPYASAFQMPYAAKYTLAEDEYFVMGDNRAHSADSRSYGAVPGINIRGRLVP